MYNIKSSHKLEKKYNIIKNQDVLKFFDKINYVHSA